MERYEKLLTLLKSKNWKPEQKNRVKQRIKDPHPENLQ